MPSSRSTALVAATLSALLPCTARAQPIDIDRLPRLTAEETLRIRLEDYRGIRIGRVVVEGGEVYVADRVMREIRVYGHDGRQRRTIGRAGRRPGELEMLADFGIHGDTVWVTDGSLGRISYFRRNGELIGTVPVREIMRQVDAETVMRIRPGEMLPDGRFTGHVQYSSPVLPDGLMFPVLLFDGRTGLALDSLGTGRQPGGEGTGEEMDPPSTGIRDPRISERRRWGASNVAGVAIVRMPDAVDGRGELTVTRRTATGDTLHHTVYAYAAMPVDDEFRDRMLRTRARVYGLEVGVDSATAFRMLRRVAVVQSRYRAPVTELWAGRDGALMLRREVEPGRPVPWVVIEPDGRARGEVELPAGALVVLYTGDDVWVEHRQGGDVHLVRLGITRSPHSSIRTY